VELVELAHMPLQRLRFGAPTVPGMVFEDGEKVLGSRAIVHRLDERVANPPLFPSDPHERARVEELERWGDEKLQSRARHPKEDMAHSLWRSRFGAAPRCAAAEREG
jgi:glutathione S-transferase